jgi:glutamyl-tRNA synthetase
MVRTRFSPSPTGLLHLGNVRTVLFSALLAKREKGIFVLRIEDTDTVRSEDKFVALLQEDLQWLGIDWQEGPRVEGPYGPYSQSKRGAIYKKYYAQLIQNKLAYPCFCSEQELAVNRKIQLSRGLPPRYPGTCMKLTAEDVTKKIAEGKSPALRFHVPDNQEVLFTDLVKGEQRFNSSDIGDFIVRRADESSSFMFCNAIDDSLMQITHVIRGEDHLTNTPRQLLILKALNLTAPQYGHLSLITGDDGAPLSKRHGSSSLSDLRAEGYLQAAVLNYMARLGHIYEKQNLLPFDELGSGFRIETLGRSPARFDKHQLLHWQKEAVMAMDDATFSEWVKPEIEQTVPANQQNEFITVVRENINFPAGIKPWVNVFFGNDLQISDAGVEVIKAAGEAFYLKCVELISTYGTDLTKILAELKNSLQVNGKKLYMPVRIALTGLEHGPELLSIAKLLGAEKVLSRLQHAVELTRDKHA